MNSCDWHSAPQIYDCCFTFDKQQANLMQGCKILKGMFFPLMTCCVPANLVVAVFFFF